MSLLLPLSQNQTLIIREVCNEQLSSLKRLYFRRADFEAENKVDALLAYNLLEVSDYKKEIRARMKILVRVRSNPLELWTLSDFELSSMRHTLSCIEDNYPMYQKDISDLWSKFFELEAYRDRIKSLINVN